MHPRLYMHSIQYAFYDVHNQIIIFESRNASGRRVQFTITRNQFLNLNDAIYQIRNHNYYGHFPIGHSTWLHYNDSDSCLYNDSAGTHFSFLSFQEYIKHTHPRLLSLVRLKQKTETETETRTRRRGAATDAGRHTSKSTNHKRPSSSVSMPFHQSPSAKRSRWEEREASPRPTNNGVLSNHEETSPVLSKWDGSSARWRSDSDSANSSIGEDQDNSSAMQVDNTPEFECLDSEQYCLQV